MYVGWRRAEGEVGLGDGRQAGRRRRRRRRVVVDFTATWCPPCRAIAPFFAELSEKYLDVLFLKVDVDAQADIAAEYSVRAMPTFKFLKDGVVVDELVGGHRPELEKKVQQNMIVDVVAA